VVIPSQAALSSAATAESVVAGRVTTAGQAAAGAKVTLYAWPRNSVVAALPKGADVPLRVVGSAVAASSGRYAIAVTNWSAVRASANGDVVNLEVMARRGQDEDVYSFSRLLTLSGALAADNDATVPGTAPQQADLSLVRGPSGTPGVVPCGTMQKVKYLGKRWSIVGLTPRTCPAWS
jgi:hypothetical protein